VPVVEALNPVPATVTAEPAGPDPGLSVICGDVAALAGWSADKAKPATIMSATNKVLSVRNTAIYPQIEKAAFGHGRRQCKSTGIDPMGKKPHSHQENRNSCPVFSWPRGTVLT
jgi:hypothetical protein